MTTTRKPIDRTAPWILATVQRRISSGLPMGESAFCNVQPDGRVLVMSRSPDRTPAIINRMDLAKLCLRSVRNDGGEVVKPSNQSRVWGMWDNVWRQD